MRAFARPNNPITLTSCCVNSTPSGGDKRARKGDDAMIAFADRSMVPALKELWKLSFGDPRGLHRSVLEHRLDKECLVDVEGERVGGMLFLLPITVITPGRDGCPVHLRGGHPSGFPGPGISTGCSTRPTGRWKRRDVIPLHPGAGHQRAVPVL